MTDRDDALRKVMGLGRLAADSSTTNSERETAAAMAVKLRLRHGISDAELEAEVEEDEDVVFFGIRLLWYSTKVQPILNRIQKEIDKALALADTCAPPERMSTYVRVYKDIQSKLDGTGYRDRSIKERRNAVIKDYYLAEFESEVADQYSDGVEVSEETTMGRRYWAHERAVSSVRLHAMDMRSDVIERIVGVSGKKLNAQLNEASWRAQKCDACGLDGKDGRDYAYWNVVERNYMHTDCREKAKRAKEAQDA